MSEQGPYNQPPQNPYGGGEYGEGQPPYGQPHGGDPHGGPPGMPGQPPYGTGGQPGYGPPGPGQPMYGGGQPPYGGGGAGYTPQPPPPDNGGGSKANLWVVIGGGAIIVVLVVAVIVTLISNNSGGESTVAADDEPEATGEPQSTEEPQSTDEPQSSDEPVTPRGEPPYALPTEPCDAFSEQVHEDFLLSEDGQKSVNDSSSSCRSSLADAPEDGEEVYGSLYAVYSVPYGDTESTDEAATVFEDAVSEVTAEDDFSLYLEDAVMEDEEVDLGDEARFILTGYDYVGEEVPQAVLLVRTENINLRIEYQLSSSIFAEEELALEDFTMPDDVQDLMVSAGEDALALVGA